MAGTWEIVSGFNDAEAETIAARVFASDINQMLQMQYADRHGNVSEADARRYLQERVAASDIVECRLSVTPIAS
jgi:hypothetical protein